MNYIAHSGTDSAPHWDFKKECDCCAAGCFTQPIALPLYAEAVDTAGAMRHLEAGLAPTGLLLSALLPPSRHCARSGAYGTPFECTTASAGQSLCRSGANGALFECTTTSEDSTRLPLSAPLPPQALRFRR